DGGALVERSDRWVRRPDVRIVALAAEQGRHVAVLAAFLLSGVHVGADAGEALEIFFDIGCCLIARDTKLVGEAERRDAVDNAKTDRLRVAAYLARHTLDRHPEHLRGGHGVDVEAVAESLPERWDVGDLGEQAQLDLRIIR